MPVDAGCPDMRTAHLEHGTAAQDVTAASMTAALVMGAIMGAS
jgi:hypothetical protein